jgi:hypothetical protein
MNAEVILKKQTYAGLFMIALANLMYEILLTRIFSVTMWYHFAFVAISVAMFGGTVGAILVYLLPNYFTQERAKYHLALSSLLFAISIVLGFLIHLRTPFIIDRSIVAVTSIALKYVVISIPFVFSGICVCLALTKFPQQVSKLYAADLVGAALGCILLIYTLNITDAPTTVIIVAFVASIGTVFFAAEGGLKKLMQIALVTSLLFASFAAANTVLVSKQSTLLPLMWVKGVLEHRPLYEKWNSFSRIAVRGNPNKLSEPFGFGLSPVYSSDRKVRQVHMNIDATAETVLTAFDGNLNNLEYLKYDLTNLVHYIRQDSKVLVIGPGGGRDILSALVFEQKSILGVEINKNIIDAVNQRFGDFTGHLDKNPRVTFINDEARSYITRQKNKFDIIHISFIDTWAATAAGAFVLTENSLYTVEAWKVFISHLNPNGILTFSRWYLQDSPAEMYRLTSLASASLKQLGAVEPRKHILITRHMWRRGTAYLPIGVGTILVSKEPFSDEDLDTIEEITNEMQFDLILSPRSSPDSTFASIASGRDLDIFTGRIPINISAPTDDSPFFFHMLRLRDMFKRELLKQGLIVFYMKAVFLLGSLLIIVVGLTFFCIIFPLILTTTKTTLKGTLPLFIFFAAIGFGFMLVEISQMQRLIVFLGHPTYALSVVLFTLLLSSGLGSYSTQKMSNLGIIRSAIVRLFLLLITLTVFGKLTPYVISIFQSSITTYRILIATIVLFPLGLFIGMAFPLGMKIAFTKSAYITPWLWGINGATSVCASVLAVAIALSFGISTSFWTGFSFYVVALIAFFWASRSKG